MRKPDPGIEFQNTLEAGMVAYAAALHQNRDSNAADAAKNDVMARRRMLDGGFRAGETEITTDRGDSMRRFKFSGTAGESIRGAIGASIDMMLGVDRRIAALALAAACLEGGCDTIKPASTQLERVAKDWCLT